MSTIFYFVILIVIFVIYVKLNKSGLTNKPSNEEVDNIISDIINNKAMFETNSKYQNTKYKFEWLDVVLFEELRQLSMKNRLNPDSIRSLILS